MARAISLADSSLFLTLSDDFLKIIFLPSGNVVKAKEALKSALKLANEAKDEETKEMIHNSLTEMDSSPS